MKPPETSPLPPSPDPALKSVGHPHPTRGQLELELADARLLHKLSIELIQEDGITGLHKKIVEAAVTLMRSQFATIQMLYPHPGSIGKLRILACSGFTPEEEKFWEWVYPNTGSSCGRVLKTQKRVVIPDYRTCDFMQKEPTLEMFLASGIMAAQSTPLFSRSGKLVGMITTHWKYPYNPPQEHLDLLEILARQAADLIERTQTSQALKQSEERRLALAAATNDIIYRMSPDWRQIYQMEDRDIVSHLTNPGENWLDKYVIPADQPMVMAAVQLAIQTKTVFQLEHRVNKADGTIGWVFSRAVPILDADDNILEWFGAASDVTAKKLTLSRLEGMVDERTKDLQRSNQDLLQFAHVASHDLKEPVRKIKIYGLLAKDELDRRPNENSGRYIQKILESAGRMSTMIEGVLIYSSMNAPQENRTDIDLNNILHDICEDLEIPIAQKQAQILFDRLPVIRGIEVLIYQLFYNLVNNSLKFSRDPEPPVIRITGETVATEDTPFVRIVVADNGIGFEETYQEKIFETFSRLHPKHTYEGTGLGLSLSRKIVERHGGAITARGWEGVGAEFIIILPQ